MKLSKAAVSPPAPVVAPVPAPVGLAPTLPGIIGAQLSQPVALMKDVLAEFRHTHTISRTQMVILGEAVNAAHRIALQSQQISRLAGGRLRQSHERLSLHTLLQEVLDNKLSQAGHTGLQVRRMIKPVEVIVDPGLLWSLLEVAVDWAAEQGQRILVSLDVKNWPEYGILMLKSSQHIAVPANDGDPTSPDTLNWHLLQQIAQAMGLMVERVLAPDHTLVMLEFPRTVKQLEGLTAVEMNVGGDSSSFMLSESKPLAGHRLLLVTADEGIRSDVKDACDMLGLVMDTTPTSMQAIRFCEMDKPHMIVIDEKLHDHYFDELREDLVRSDINFPCVEISSASNTFEMSNWMGDSISRISRDALRAQLSSILVMELAKVT
ncbi:MAG: hypothetical protein ABIU07_10040 [Ramlibacter sp.]